MVHVCTDTCFGFLGNIHVSSTIMAAFTAPPPEGFYAKISLKERMGLFGDMYPYVDPLVALTIMDGSCLYHSVLMAINFKGFVLLNDRMKKTVTFCVRKQLAKLLTPELVDKINALALPGDRLPFRERVAAMKKPHTWGDSFDVNFLMYQFGILILLYNDDTGELLTHLMIPDPHDYLENNVVVIRMFKGSHAEPLLFWNPLLHMYTGVLTPYRVAEQFEVKAMSMSDGGDQIVHFDPDVFDEFADDRLRHLMEHETPVPIKDRPFQSIWNVRPVESHASVCDGRTGFEGCELESLDRTIVVEMLRRHLTKAVVRRTPVLPILHSIPITDDPVGFRTEKTINKLKAKRTS